MQINSTQEIIDDLKQGKMVIIMDDEDRENEGDLVMAADKVTAEAVNFMAKFGRGLICLTLTEDRCRQLRLPLMVTDNQTPYATNFTVSIEAAEGVTTGISAADRALTIQKAVATQAKPEDLVQPGHIFPLKAQPGGVLTRAGHTEAGCDLAHLAGCTPAAVIVEILNDDGTMARRPDLEIFAETHQLKIGTIADLISYRLQNEMTIKAMSTCNFPTEYGDFTLHSYQDDVNSQTHLALVYGDIDAEQETLVRVHMADPLGDLLASKREPTHWPLPDVMRRIQQAGKGVLVVLRQPEQNKQLAAKIARYQQQDQGEAAPFKASWDLRTFGVGAQILADLGVRKMRVIGTPTKLTGVSGFGLELTGYLED
ncbi:MULTISPECIES: bifunctional 3,4-dihydroxy-2-butanone-4-phosphate synthase/GTP cyclohydrolase II [Methylophaga]|uniref:3,4-dihydroxy-2-butanone 4-phosphate synthase n=1 Tax=Methylophaga muralis TaxID=291169 RepID=A0A1E3GRP0_9GAMM|nr:MULTISPECIES: bifunctional 3,4-dihydroxy-2-butanone-4-phosphate synthase/GTP cyclohydrolase II [Methylophaga]ODN66720.1 Riboflavin biosynthesis protein RibBA [Methylophaga muralis]THF72252.1 MAG: bifunctional 3,4-dihydroxy-2-butanone-4-phosphate synthase/GTP cyclohydrolase II [Methylophaga nitratireducenticrescens]THK41915.1 bifunctional 3,4-dihydroxy-2-butanone-4-phosphate synthase/GTP cyclohydrolase II [Methylophaga sp. SB9B]